jgi:hypothetical protein
MEGWGEEREAIYSVFLLFLAKDISTSDSFYFGNVCIIQRATGCKDFMYRSFAGKRLQL